MAKDQPQGTLGPGAAGDLNDVEKPAPPIEAPENMDAKALAKEAKTVEDSAGESKEEKS